jgi:hypothetical protein
MAPTKKYPSRKTLAKLSLSEVIARLLATGTAKITRLRYYDDDHANDPFLTTKPLTFDEHMDRRLARYEWMARHSLFYFGVHAYVGALRLSDIDAQLKARNLSTAWSNRSNSSEDKEEALVSAIMQENP